MIAIIDYGMGNLRSVQKALQFVGQDAVITSDLDEINKADKIVLPGVGAIGDAMETIRKKGFDKAIYKACDEGKPFLGICLGMQMVFDKSYEYGEHKGLGLIPGTIQILPDNVKKPHIGWNNLNVKMRAPLFENTGESPYVYFVHSYYLETDAPVVSATTFYGKEIQVAVQKDNIFALQFHPEKSGDVGLQILKIIYPAIDIIDGKAVRLSQGKFDDVTVFNDIPADAAKDWVDAGAEYIHIVDLDGARYGKSFITGIIKDITEKYNIPVQTGGGVRTIQDVEDRINAGASRVIIGTAAVKNPELVKEAVEKFGDKIAVGVDAKNGMVAISGWEEVSDISAVDLCLKMKDYGVKTVIYTDISKDGMMSGPNIEATKDLIDKTGLDVIASGGVSKMEDLENVESIGSAGVIIGKALYNGALDLKQVLSKFKKGE